MKRLVPVTPLLALAIGVMLIVAAASPAAAGLEKNKNALPLFNMECEDGTFWGDVLVNPGNSGHGIVVDDGSSGVAKSLYILDGPGGNKVVEVNSTPGKGLGELTMWCWWDFPPGFPFGEYGGGDVLWYGKLRNG